MTVVEHVPKTDEEWKKQLTPEQYEVCRRKGTELPFSGEYYNSKEKEYTDVYTVVMSYSVQITNSIQELDGPVSHNQSSLELDLSHGMIRKEVKCTKCGARLGHVFGDGPAPTGKRYCINSIALSLDKNNK